MREEKRVIIVDPERYSLMVNDPSDFRNALLKEGHPTENVDDLLLKVIDAPTKRLRRRAARETR